MSNCCCNKEESINARELRDEIVKKFYDNAAIGKGFYQIGTDKFSPDGPTDKIIEILKNTDSKRILDIGCGMGHTILRIINEYPADMYIGIDFSENMIAKAKQSLLNFDSCIRKKTGFFVANALDLPFMDAQFDFVLSECVLNLISDRDRVMREINRILKPGGVFIYTDFISNYPVPDSIKNDIKFVSGCRAGSITMQENLYYLKKYGFDEVGVFDYTKEKEQRYLNLLEDNVETKNLFEKFKKTRIEATRFLDEEIGYYVVKSRKS